MFRFFDSPIPHSRSWALAALLVVALAATISYAAAGNEHSVATREPAGHPPILWSSPEFSLADQRGGQLTEAALRGHVWIANFIFTHCTSVCPTLTAKMRVLQRKLTSSELRFVSFSVDPQHDTVSALRAYSEVWGKDEPRWSLLHTESESLQRLSDGLRVVAQPSGNGANPILHTSLFFLIDTAGRVRGLYDSNDPGAMQRLLDDAQLVAGDDSALEASPAGQVVGKAVFDGLGCAGCHDDPKLAPSLRGIRDRLVSLADGTTARADQAYIRESIRAPGARLVAEFIDSMPAYASELSEPQLDALVEYVISLRPAAPIGSAPVALAEPVQAPRPAPLSALVEDPVCGMKVRVTAETPRASRDGHPYYFCSSSCRDRFLAKPSEPHH